MEALAGAGRGKPLTDVAMRLHFATLRTPGRERLMRLVRPAAVEEEKRQRARRRFAGRE
jgi:hypothetical protein